MAESWVRVTDMSTRWLRTMRVSRSRAGLNREASSAIVVRFAVVITS